MAFTPGKTVAIELNQKPSMVPLHPDYPQVALFNTGPGLAFVVLGVGPLEPETPGFPLPPMVPVVLTKGVGADSLLAWCLYDYVELYVTPGSGA